jgi:hypothetical protein
MVQQRKSCNWRHRWVSWVIESRFLFYVFDLNTRIPENRVILNGAKAQDWCFEPIVDGWSLRF